MRELVEHDLGAVEALASRVGGSRNRKLSWNVDRGHVLHRAGVELGHEELVVLVERVGLVEERRVEVEALAS